ARLLSHPRQADRRQRAARRVEGGDRLGADGASMRIAEIRQAIQVELQAELGFEFVAGIVPSNPRQERYGCVWVGMIEETAEHVLEEDVEVFVRVFVGWQQAVDPALPIDPLPVEQLADDVRAALKDKQASSGIG